MGQTEQDGPQSPTRSGSEGASEPEFLIVGQVIRPHGVRGEMKVKAITAYPERLTHLSKVYIGPDYKPYRLKRVRPHQQGIILLVEGINTREEADLLRRDMVHIHISDAVPLEEGEYYLFQLEGIRVITDTGSELGTFTGFLETGANDVYIITTPDGKEILLPAIPEVIQNVDLEQRIMTVHLLDGLID